MQTFAKLPMRRPMASAKRGQSAPGASANAPVSSMRRHARGQRRRCCRRSAGQSSTSGAVRLRGGREPAMYHRARMTEAAGATPPARRAARGRPGFILVALAAAVSVVVPGLHAGRDAGPLRSPGRRPVPRLPVRAGRSWRDIRSATTPARPPSTGATSLLYTFGLALPAGGRDPRRRTHRLRHRDRRRLLRGVGAAGAVGRHPAGGAARRDAGRAPGRPRRPRRVVLPLRVRHRALPVPRPVAARAMAGQRRRGGAPVDGAGRAARAARARRDCPSRSPWPRPGSGAPSRPAAARRGPAAVAARGGRPGRARPVPRAHRLVAGNVRRGQVAARELRPQPGAGHRQPNTASTWCAGCCSASTRRRCRSGSAADGPRCSSRRWPSLFIAVAAIVPSARRCAAPPPPGWPWWRCCSRW